MKGKVAGILLLFCLIAPIATTFTFLHYQKKQIKKEVKRQIIAGIDKEEMVLLKFTKVKSQTKLHWEHSKEFEYNSQMYDVVEKEIKGDTIYYWCWWDHEETVLNKKLDNLVAYALEHDAQRKESQKRVENFYNSLYFNPLPNWDYFVIQSDQLTISYKYSYKTISYSPPFPPPEIS